MNFKRLLPLPLKASCSLRLRFMLFIQMKKTHFSFKRPSFPDVLKKGLERLWKNDGMSVAFHHSSTSAATEGDLRSLFIPALIWAEMIRTDQRLQPDGNIGGKSASLKCSPSFFFPFSCLFALFCYSRLPLRLMFHVASPPPINEPSQL